jgi:hypothetical protein
VSRKLGHRMRDGLDKQDPHEAQLRAVVDGLLRNPNYYEPWV